MLMVLSPTLNPSYSLRSSAASNIPAIQWKQCLQGGNLSDARNTKKQTRTTTCSVPGIIYTFLNHCFCRTPLPISLRDSAMITVKQCNQTVCIPPVKQNVSKTKHTAHSTRHTAHSTPLPTTKGWTHRENQGKKTTTQTNRAPPSPPPPLLPPTRLDPTRRRLHSTRINPPPTHHTQMKINRHNEPPPYYAIPKTNRHNRKAQRHRDRGSTIIAFSGTEQCQLILFGLV